MTLVKMSFSVVVSNAVSIASAMWSGIFLEVAHLRSKAGVGAALTASALGYAAFVSSASGCYAVP